MHRRGLLPGLLLLMTVLLSVPHGWVGAQDEEQRLAEVEQQIGEVRDLIEGAEAQRTEYVVQIEEMEARLEDLREQLWAAEDEVTAAEAAVAVGLDAVNNLNRRVRLLEAELAAAELEQEHIEATLRERSVDLYMSGSTGVGSLFVGDWDPESNVIRLEYGRRVFEDTEMLLRTRQLLQRQQISYQEDLIEERQREAEILEVLESDRARAAAYRTAVEVARQTLGEQLAAQEALLAELVELIEDHESHVAALQVASRDIELEILRRQVREGQVPGVLAWPVSGGLTSPFGWRVHPIFGDRRLHTGIDLRGVSGEPIRAAANGTVVLAETWGGYGRTVVLDHGGGLSTVYAHQSRIGVSVGQRVAAGEVVGYIGCTGFCTGPHLHFEVREIGSPVDPMGYLPG